MQRRILLLQCGVLLLLVFPFVSPTFRDNDQATILDRAWQVAHGQSPFLHATFYNFDKQWGVFLALSWLYKLLPRADPVFAANALLTILAAAAWLTFAFRTGRSRRAPLTLLLPVLLSPVLILYMPFLGTGWFSLAFLLLAFFFLGNVGSKPSRIFGLLLISAAAACRGDVVLAIPALALSLMSRVRLVALIRRPFPWLLAAAAILPVLFGKLIAGSTIPDSNPLSFDVRSYVGFLAFGFTPAMLLLLGAAVTLFLILALRRSRFRCFYAALAVSPLIPLGFYSAQLYTLRYFFLVVASTLFVASSPRAICLYRGLARKSPKLIQTFRFTLVCLTLLPWIVGLNAPSLTHVRPTVTRPTLFPTGDGNFPMGAYLAFDAEVLKEHFRIDHNQKIWLSARSVDYRSCPNGVVPFLITPMSNFIEFAIRTQGKTPLAIDYLAESPCGIAYVDARSIIRGYRPTAQDGAFLQHGVSLASATNNGELVVEIDGRARQTEEAQLLAELSKFFDGREIEIFQRIPRPIALEPGREYVVFSSLPCHVTSSGTAVPLAQGGLLQAAWTVEPAQKRKTAEAACPAAFAGWAQTMLPPYMGL